MKQMDNNKKGTERQKEKKTRIEEFLDSEEEN